MVAIFVVLNFPTMAYATHGFGSGYTNIYVDGTEFQIWGYFGDGPMPAFRLGDIAYILNGTPVQFEISTPPDDRWDFWIQRGTPYTPMGDELRPVHERHVVLGSYGFAGGVGFYTDPFHTIVLGIDGTDAPATTIAFDVIKDVDDIYFPLHELGALLGFELCDFDCWPMLELTTTPKNAAILPEHSPEFIELMVRLSGGWVDSVYFDSPTIDESVVWPVAFSIFPFGFTDTVHSGSRIAPKSNSIDWELREYYSLQKRELENGLIELTIDPTGIIRRNSIDFTGRLRRNSIDFTGRPYHEAYHDITRFHNHRIIVDASQPQIEDITLYIGDTAHHMTRFRMWELDAREATRFYAVPMVDGGILLRYVIRPWFISVWGERVDLQIHRSMEHGDQGELIYTRELTDFYDRILFEFTDPTAQLGNVYYYTLSITRPNSNWNTAQTLQIGDSEGRIQSQMRVDLTINENEARTVAFNAWRAYPVPDINNTPATFLPEARPMFPLWLSAAIFAAIILTGLFVAGVVIIIVRRVKRQRG